MEIVTLKEFLPKPREMISVRVLLRINKVAY